MTLDNAPSLEAAKSTGRARQIALKAAFSLMQIGLGAACVIGTFWGVTRFLAGDFEAAGRAPTSPGASATGIASGVLAVATQVRATEMPEIKRGVPEQMPVRVSTSTATDQPKLSPTVIRNFAAKPISTTQVEFPLIGSTAAWHDESSSDRRRLHEEQVTSDASAPGLNSTPIVPEVPPDVPAIITGPIGPSVTSSPQVASTTLDADSAKEAVSGVNRQDAEAAKVSAAASAEPRTRSTRVLRAKSPQQGGPPPQSCPPTALTRRERGLPSAPIRHPQGKRGPAAMRRRSEMINQQSPSAREWPLRHPNQARLPLHRQQRLRLRSSGCTSLASLCLLDERSGNVCLSGAADRVRSQELLSQVGQYGHTRLDYRRLRLRLPWSQHPVASRRP